MKFYSQGLFENARVIILHEIPTIDLKYIAIGTWIDEAAISYISDKKELFEEKVEFNDRLPDVLEVMSTHIDCEDSEFELFSDKSRGVLLAHFYSFPTDLPIVVTAVHDEYNGIIGVMAVVNNLEWKYVSEQGNRAKVMIREMYEK